MGYFEPRQETKPSPRSRLAAITSFVPCPKACERGTWDNTISPVGVVGRLTGISRRRSKSAAAPCPLGQPPTARCPPGEQLLTEVACRRRWRHNARMGRDRGEQATPDLFSTETVRDGSPSPIKLTPAAQIAADASSHRHVLPKHLRKAVKHLSDAELDLLHAATFEEMGRRGRLPPIDQATNCSSRTDKSSFHRQPTELATISLTRGQINAVRAAFKAGIKPTLIARQFGISQSDVRKVLAMDARKARSK
jgi:hypothetical protein